MTDETVRAAPDWLALREPADAAARSLDLVDELRSRLTDDRPLVIHDLGCGTGSMYRWLAPKLPTPQHWVLHDRDVALLDLVALGDGFPADVTVETRADDITRLSTSDLADASLITASALLDMFARDELDRFVDACVAAGAPALITLSVVGRAAFDPEEPADRQFEDAFNDHQRRVQNGRELLGPDASSAAVRRFTELGYVVRRRASVWELGPDQSALIDAWLDGWVNAAVEQDPGLAESSRDYLDRRRGQLAAGHLTVRLHHDDLLAIPR